MKLSVLFFLNLFFGLSIIGLFFVVISYKKRVQIKIFKSLKQKALLKPNFYYDTEFIKKECLKEFLKIPLRLDEKYKKSALKNKELALKKITKDIKNFPNDSKLLLLYAELCFLNQEISLFKHALNKVKLSFFSSREFRAKYFYLLAQFYTYETDLDSASKFINKALLIYKKRNDTYEEGLCYQTLAQIYRVSGFSDLAITLFNEAITLFSASNLSVKTAEVKAYLGLNEMTNNNNKMALEYLKEAENICQKNKLTELLLDIKNWQSLCYFLEQDFKTAYNNLAKVLEAKNIKKNTLAFALDLKIRINFKNKKITSALKDIDLLIITLKESQNKTSLLEALYLKAELFYALKKYDKATEILTELIKDKISPQSLYYPANAYTLLGLISLEKKELNKAKTLFKKALDLEHSKDRIKGAAIDYNNLAEISIKEGNKEEAKELLNKAIEHANTLEDNELKEYLTSKLNTYF